MMKVGLTFALSFFMIQVFNQKLEFGPRPQGLIPPPKYIEHLAFGYRDAMADSIWLRLIQDYESCEIMRKASVDFHQIGNELRKDRETRQRIEARNEEALHVVDAIKSYPIHGKNCRKGWAFTMMDAITQLAPRFHMAYVLGAVALSVISEDFDGAKIIFDRGVEQFPTDWVLLYRAAYSALFDQKDFAKAAELMNRAADNGAPLWLKSLAARLYTQEGQAELGIRLLTELLKKVDPERVEARKSIAERIEKLKGLVEKKHPEGH